MDRITITDWSEGDLPLLRRLLGDPAMMEHLGGPESEEQITLRQQRYERLETGRGRIFRIAAGGDSAGSVGFWQRDWRGEGVYEMGWSVLPEFQGRGVAVAAGRLVIAAARSEGRYRHLHAFPAVGNVPSNRVCRRLGFSLLEDVDLEYPVGHAMRCADWRLDLALDGLEAPPPGSGST